jgi:glucose/arabinose dehydrogenase
MSPALRTRLAGLVLALLVGVAPAAFAQGSRRIAAGLDLPIFATAPAGDGRIFVVEQGGLVRIVQNATSGVVLPTPFLDLRFVVAYFGGDDERGLLGLAFPSDYATSGFFYVYYVSDPTIGSDPTNGGTLTLARYTRSAANPNVADPASAKVLLRIPKPPARPDLGGGSEFYHNGGTLAFGPDGKLYLGLGDGAGWLGNDPNNCAQNAASPLGKMLRVTLAQLPPSGVVVPEAATSTGCPGPLPAASGVEIWASGLRNPYRWSFDRQTGDLYVGDVGQDDREEIDVAAAASLAGPGPNYGWRAFEGNICNPNLVPSDPLCAAPGPVTFPVHDYAAIDGEMCDASVVGGVVYRGALTELQGRYVFADFCQGFVRTLVWNGAGGINGPVLDLKPALSPAENGGVIDFVSGIGEDGDGELLLVDFDGDVFRVPEPGAAALALAAAATLHALARLRSGARCTRVEPAGFLPAA